MTKYNNTNCASNRSLVPRNPVHLGAEVPRASNHLSKWSHMVAQAHGRAYRHSAFATAQEFHSLLCSRFRGHAVFLLHVGSFTPEI